MIQTQIREILQILCTHRVEFIIVGGAAAQLQGAPISTFDLDILYARSEENIERLQAALAEMEAEFRGDIADRHLKPNASHLRSSGHKLLKTRLGQLDVLATIEDTTTYDDVLADVERLDLGGMKCRCSPSAGSLT
jgi:predicted nucleotidyltransferase